MRDCRSFVLRTVRELVVEPVLLDVFRDWRVPCAHALRREYAAHDARAALADRTHGFLRYAFGGAIGIAQFGNHGLSSSTLGDDALDLPRDIIADFLEQLAGNSAARRATRAWLHELRPADRLFSEVPCCFLCRSRPNTVMKG